MTIRVLITFEIILFRVLVCIISLDPLTGDCIYGPKIQLAAQRLQEAIQAAAEGTFQPDREREELTYALGNPEHSGRTRGKGVVPWKYGFMDYIESYRSR